MKKYLAAFAVSALLFSIYPAPVLAQDAKPVEPSQPEQAVPVQPQEPAPRTTIADGFKGERLTYKIGFWIFDNVAEGGVSLKKEDDGTYTGTLTAHTTGVVDKIILSRQDTYVSHMALSDDGTRFVSLSFEKTVDKNGSVRHGTTEFDYDKHVMTWKSWGGGGGDKSGAYTFPADVTPVDPITAFYNFRAGSYGAIERGKEYVIPSFPKEDRVPNITIRVDTAEDAKKRDLPDNVDYLAFARIDKELFGSTSGDIEIYFTSKMVPVYAVAKDILFFGDVRGTLARTVVREKPEKLASTTPQP